MLSSSDDAHSPVQSGSSERPAKLQFSLKLIFGVIAGIATIAAGATSAGAAGVVLAILGLDILLPHSLLVIIVAFVGSALFGFLPPWPIWLILATGLIIATALRRFDRRSIAAFAAITNVLLALWLLRPDVDIRAATADDPLRERYFGIHNEKCTPRNIAVVSGIFTLDRWLTASLYHIKSGAMFELNSVTVGRSPNQIGAPYWVKLNIVLALGDEFTANGRSTQLGSAGHSRGGGGGGEAVNDVRDTAHKIVPGQLSRGTKRLVYIEGDEDVSLDATMTLAEFARRNQGNYLVVELELN